MLKFMKKIPAGLLLIPMLISALFNTFLPGFFDSLGGVSKAFFTTSGISYIVALVCFCSATLLDLKSIKVVMKKQGTLLILKIVLCLIFGYLYIAFFGVNGIFGISAIAFVVAICSLNPSLYLALVSDYGIPEDKAAFGLTGLLCVPAFPIFIYSVTYGGSVNWTPIISTLIPIFLGVFVGNTDKDLGKMFSSMVGPLMPIMGWSFGAGINIIDALKAGPSGIVLTIAFYITMLPIIYLFETRVLKENGISALGISSIAGMSVAVPSIMAVTNAEYAAFSSTATAQIAFGVVISSIITPIITQKIVKMKGLKKND